MAKLKNKESDNTKKGATVDKVDESAEAVKVKPKKKQKDYTNVPPGVGGQFVDIGGGIRVPASEV